MADQRPSRVAVGGALLTALRWGYHAIMRWVLRLAMVTTLVVLGGACTTEVVAPDMPLTPRAHASDTFEAARYFPASTAVFLAASSLKNLLKTSSYKNIQAVFPEPFERLSFGIAERTGLSPLDPASLTEMGVALDQPAGLAFPSLRRHEELQPVIFLTLSDPARFKATLYRSLAPTRRADLEIVGNAVVIRGDGFSVVVRDRIAFVITGYGHPIADAVARQPEASSLAWHPGFRASLAAIEPATVVGYVDVRGMIYADAGLDPRWSGTDLGAARRDLDQRHAAALERARKAASDADVLWRIDEDFRRARNDLAEEEGMAPLRAIVGSIEGAGLALRLQPTGAALEAVVLMAEDAPLRASLGSGPPCPSSSFLGERAFSIEAHLDLAATETLAKEWGLAEELFAVLTEVEVPREAFDGAFCAAASLPAGGLAAVEDPTDLDFVVRVGLRQPDMVRAALGRLGQIPGAPPLRATGDRFQLKLGDRTATIAIEGSSLVASTQSARVPAREDPLDAWRALEAPEPRALALAFEIGLWLSPERASEAVARRLPDLSKSRSEAYTQKQAELDAAERALEMALRAAVQTSRRDFADQAATLGAVSVVVTPVAAGLRLDARWSVRAPSLVEALAALDGRPSLDPWTDPELVPLLERRTALERELEALGEEVPPAQGDAPSQGEEP
jgi:hypothetical protein